MAKEAKKETEEFDTEIAGADKAREIGKELGAEDDKKHFLGEKEEETPDFEIIEEDDKPVTKKTSEDDDRIVRDKTPNRQTAKEKREAKKKLYRKHGFQEGFTAAEQAYKPIIETLIKKQSEVDTRLTGVTKSEIERAFNDAQGRAQQAEREYIDAVSTGDGVRAMNTLKVLSDTKDRMTQLQTVYKQVQTAPAEPRKNEWDADVINYANDWKQRNNWFDPNGGDDDSAITNTIASALVREGFNPKTEKYWEELDSRLERKNIAVARDEEEDAEEEEERPTVRKRTSPPVSGSANGRGDVKGRQRVTIPTKTIELWKQQVPDAWNDPKRRNKLIANYIKERQDMESGA